MRFVTLFLKPFLSRNTTSGFTLIEVLISITVFTSVIFVPLSIIAQYLIQNPLTENRVQANFFAQEVVEYVRYTRDLAVATDADENWFSALRSLQGTFGSCTIPQGDWITGNWKISSDPDFCILECEDDTGTVGECGSVVGFVTGVSRSGTHQGNDATCDGGPPKSGGALTTTLTIIVPDSSISVAFATLRPCVSWVDANDAIKKVELQETLFEWLIRS